MRWPQDKGEWEDAATTPMPFPPGELRGLWLGFCSGASVMAVCAVYGWGSRWHHPLGRGFAVPLQKMQRSRAAVSVLLLAPSCSAGTETSLLPSNCLSHVCACPLSYKNIFFHSIELQGRLWLLLPTFSGKQGDRTRDPVLDATETR